MSDNKEDRLARFAELKQLKSLPFLSKSQAKRMKELSVLVERDNKIAMKEEKISIQNETDSEAVFFS